MPADDLTRAFTSALEACGGSPVVVAADGLADAVAGLAGRHGIALLSPDVAALVAELRSRGVDARLISSGGSLRSTASALSEVPAADLSAVAPLAACAITGAVLGIAASGTVAIDMRCSDAGLLSCLPPHHIVVLTDRAIVRCLAEALEILASAAHPEGPSFVLISGPSRTSDIEMMSVLGVHGPLNLDVVIVREDASHA